MTLLRAQAPAKINLGLFVGPRRADGRHELVSVMQSITLGDELTLDPAPEGLEADEVVCPGVEGPNLAARALELFRARSGWSGPPVRLTIDKQVPVAAGLGGGSGDAAATLRLVAAASGLEDEDVLAGVARELGADVPAQVRPGRWLATGAGEELQELPPPLPGFGVLVLAVEGELSTAAVYEQAERLGAGRDARELRRAAVELRGTLGMGLSVPPEHLLVNDLQAAARSLCPGIDEALEAARENGADACLVSGSGPTVIGLYLRTNIDGRMARAMESLAGRWPAPVVAWPAGVGAGAVDRGF